MRTILKFTLRGSASPTARWLDEFVHNAATPAASVNMRAAGCALIRSVVEGPTAALTFEWSTPTGGALDQKEFVEWFATRPGWPFEITSENVPPQLGAAAEGESLYGPDVNGWPCSPPPAGTPAAPQRLDPAPCPPPGDIEARPAAPPMDESAEITG